MVQILNARPSFGSKFTQAFNPSFQRGMERFLDESREEDKEKRKLARQQEDLASENTALKRLGVDVEGVINPKIREAFVDQKGKQSKNEADINADAERTQVIGKYFGNEAAEVYPHLTEGGKTKLFESLLDGKMRGIETSQILGKFIKENPQDIAALSQPEQPTESGEMVPGQPRPKLTPKEQAQADQKQLEFNRESQSKRSGKILEEADDMRKNLPIQQANIDLIKSGITEGNVGGIDQDFVAEILHFEPLRTAKGTQLKTAGKDLFIKTIQGTGNRPNQWIEQQIGSALTQIGKTPEANLTIAEIAQFQHDLNKKRIETIDNLEDKYQKELGYVPGKIGREADQEVQKYAKTRQEELAFDLRKIYERELGPDKLKDIKKVPNGTPLTREMAKIIYDKTDPKKSVDERKKDAEAKAKKIGFTIPSKEIYSRGS